MDLFTLSLLAHLSAHRRLLITLYTYRFLNEPQPLKAADALRETFANAPTQAPENGSGLDPASSDLLAAMTDETIEDILNRVIVRLEEATRRDPETEFTSQHTRPRFLSRAGRS